MTAQKITDISQALEKLGYERDTKMTSEINRDFYCLAGNYNNLFCKESRFTCIANSYCKNYHRKWLTPEQFKEKYGFDYPDDAAVYYREPAMTIQNTYGNL